MSERETRTFDFRDGSVEDSSFNDIDSSADRLMSARDVRRSRFERIRHAPWRTDQGKANWTKIGALATVITVPVGIAAAVFAAVGAM